MEHIKQILYFTLLLYKIYISINAEVAAVPNSDFMVDLVDDVS